MNDDENEKFDSSILTDSSEVESKGETVVSEETVLNDPENTDDDVGSTVAVPSDMVLKDDYDGDDFTSSVVPKGMEVVEEELEDDDEEEEDLEDVDGFHIPKPSVIKKATAYTCPVCHTTFCTMNRAAVARCFYCNSPGVKKVDDASYGDFYVVPFMDTLKDAISTYKKRIRFNPLVPFSFRSSKTFKRIRKIYVPGSLFNITAKGPISFLGGEKIGKVQGSPMQTFESLYTTEFEYDNLLLSNCPQIGDECLSIINNYNYANIKEFDPSMLADSFAMVGNTTTKDSIKLLMNKIVRYSVNIVRSNVEHSLKKAGNTDLVTEVTSYKNVLVPVYYLSQTYKGKKYRFIMNGQTGESIFDYPTSGLSVFLFGLLVFAIVFGVTALIASFM